MYKPNITMFFPAYNEEENIPKLLSSATKILKEITNNYEILIIVYEGSTDGTIDAVKRFTNKDKTRENQIRRESRILGLSETKSRQFSGHRKSSGMRVSSRTRSQLTGFSREIKLLIQPKNKKGVGYAKIMGFKNAKYPYIFYADADNQFNLEDFKKFLPYIRKYDIIAGYRIKRNDSKARIVVSRIYNAMMRLLFGAKERDLDCAFRLVNKRVIDNINLACSTGVATTELLVKARKKGFQIKEIGVAHQPRTSGQSAFETGLSLPKPREVYKILKEIVKLWVDMHIKGN